MFETSEVGRRYTQSFRINLYLIHFNIVRWEKMIIKLRELSLEDSREVYDMLQEIGPGENGFGNNAYGLSFEEFKQFLQKNVNSAKGIELTAGHVPQTIYWLFIDGRPVGIGKLRHYLNDQLLKRGGHIGYSIRPTQRAKGYGNILLNEVLKKAKEKEIKEALLTCNEDNILSRNVIETNGGELEDICEGKCRYWIRRF